MEKRDILIHLSGENYSMARAEADALCDMASSTPPVLLEEDTVMTHSPIGEMGLFHSRMGLAHRVLDMRYMWSMKDVKINSFESEAAAILDDILEERSFWIRPHKLHLCPPGIDAMGICRRIGEAVGGNGGTMKSPEINVELWFGENVYMGLSVGEVNRRDISLRRVDLRPFFLPVSIHPRYVRWCINLARVRKGQRLYDPFCGTGGTLLEACSMGIEAVGSDIREDMVTGTMENLKHFGFGGDVFLHDIMDHTPELNVAGIVTDSPYGRSTTLSGSNVGDLAHRCISVANDLLGKGDRLVMGFPSTLDMGVCDGMEKEAVHSLYVHKSLTRDFIVCRKE